MLSIIFAWPMRNPVRAAGSTYGARLMFSMPPAMITSASPQRMAWAPRCRALRPEPQTLFRVRLGTAWGRPARIEAWRAGFWPLPAVSTWPRITSSTCAGSRPVCSSRRRITAAPSSGAGMFASEPWKLPTAVRVAATITTSCMESVLTGSAFLERGPGRSVYRRSCSQSLQR